MWFNFNKLFVDDNFIGPGYGISSYESLKTTRLVAKYSGLLFDPIYTSKAFAGLICYRKNNTISKNSKIVFIHSGGLSNYNLIDFRGFLFWFNNNTMEKGKIRPKFLMELL